MALFSRNKTDEETVPSMQQQNVQPEELTSDDTTRSRPEVREEDFIDTSDPNVASQTVETSTPQVERRTIVEYTMGMPIDGVYIYMEKDWEEQGCRDAENNPDITYMETKIAIIKQGLQRRFDLSKLNYNKKIREYTSRIDNLNQLGLSSTMSELEAHIDTCKEHLEKINELEERFHQNDMSLMSMIESYRRGFLLGVSRATQDTMSQNSSLS